MQFIRKHSDGDARMMRPDPGYATVGVNDSEKRHGALPALFVIKTGLKAPACCTWMMAEV
jgi:hypothetical protein